MGRFVGIDWGAKFHQVCVVDAQGDVIAERAFPHDPEHLQLLAGFLHQQEQLVGVAIEVPRGVVVETLLERNIAVFVLNPKQLDRFRDRFTVAGAKDDRRDARVLADSLRTDAKAFRRVELDEPWLAELRELSRLEGELVAEEVAHANALREHLGRYFPQVLSLTSDVDAPWVMQLLERAPTPALAAGLSRSKIATILAENRIRKFTADEVQTALRRPGFAVAPGTVEAASLHATSRLRRLIVTVQELRACRAKIAGLLDQASENGETDLGQKDEQRDVTILSSLPGVGRTILAALLAEASQPLRTRDYQTLRAMAGVAPITKQSGKSRLVVRRMAANQRLANAIYHWARCATQRDPLTRARYRALREKGHTHGRALRTVADRLLAVAIAMLRSRQAFDPCKKLAA